MRRFEEKREHDLKKDIELGIENEKCLRNMSSWCKNVRIKKVSEGLYAQMTGLPIATHRIGCSYVETESESMNLNMLFTAFLQGHCRNCKNHIPNGNISWAKNIIDQYNMQISKMETEVQSERNRTVQLHQELRKEIKSIESKVDSQSKSVLCFYDTLFSDNEAERLESAKRIQQSAYLAPELFTDEEIKLTISLSTSNDFCKLILPICIELAKKRSDLSSQLKDIALNNIEKGLEVELAASLLVTLGASVNYPLDTKYIEQLIILQKHYSPFPCISSQSNYSQCTIVLVRNYDKDSKTVEGLFSKYLHNSNEILRVQICGSLKSMQAIKPEIAINLLDDLIGSLTLYETSDYISPSSEIVYILKMAFQYLPSVIDEKLNDSMTQVRPAVQEDIINVYRNLSIDLEKTRGKRCEAKKNKSYLDILIYRLISWIKNDSLDIDIRDQASEALSVACRNKNENTLPYFNSLLGYYIIISEQKTPPVPQRIILPGQPNNNILNSMDQLLRNQKWNSIKSNLQKCLQEICSAKPSETVYCVSDCLNHPLEELNDEFKECCVLLLGKIGNNYQFKSLVMPNIWRTLTDYGSARTRAAAIEAIIEIFNYSDCLPPENLVDVLILHLHDPKVVVHKAALQAVSWHPYWFNEKQSIEVLYYLSILLKAYNKDIYQQKDICEGIIAIGHRYKRLKIAAIDIVESVFPTGDALVDSGIVENMIRHYKPCEEFTAARISKDIAIYLSKYDRDRYNSYAYSERCNMFEWLLELSKETFEEVKDELLNSAKAVAKRDLYETLYFASVFTYFKEFNFEHITVASAIDSLPKEPRNSELRHKLNKISKFSMGNALLQAEKIELALKTFQDTEVE